jgi:gamma-glutamylcyclotransferase (GGCT)/AIG2-like uncharacterized protein YtfP
MEHLLNWCEKYGAGMQGIGAILVPLILIAGFLFTWSQLKDARHNKSFDFYIEMFERFYDLNHLDQDVRICFEYRFFDTIAPLMEKWLVYPEMVTKEESARFVGIDAFLNFFEIVAHASTDKRLLQSATYRDVMFSYWFDLMTDDNHAILRRYLCLSFEAIRRRAGFVSENPKGEPVLLAVYGTLMTGQANKLVPGVHAKMRSLGTCFIPGVIVEVSDDRDGSHYPGLVLSSNKQGFLVTAELFEVGEDDQRAAGVLKAIDAYEEFSPGSPADSPFTRRFVAVCLDRDQNKKKYAWVYVYNRPTSDMPIIENGDWAKFVGTRAGRPLRSL